MLIILVSLLLSSSYSADAYIRDYYWRDFNGPIPGDAVEGGKSDVNGSTYIGQAMNVDLSPVEIHEGRNEVYVPTEFPTPQSDLIKILCTNEPLMLRWYHTTSEEFLDLVARKNVIRGGYDTKNSPFYIGRVLFYGEQIIGRVRTDVQSPYMESLWWSGARFNYHRSVSFDVLVYEDI